MINRLVFENLRHRKLRTGLTALSIGFQVVMILTIVGLSRGMLQDSANRARGVGADIWVKSPDASIISLSSGTMPQALLDYYAQQPHVAHVAGSLIALVGGISTVNGIDIDDFIALSGPFQYVEGGPFSSPNDIIIDSWWAEQNKKRVGDTVKILNRDWRVCGVVQPGKLSRLFVPLDTLQDATNNHGKLTQVFLKLDDRHNTNAVIEALKAAQPGYKIYSIEEFLGQFAPENLPMLQSFIYVITALSIVVGFLVVSLTMYTVVLERTREIGILKALGASPLDILWMLARETIVLAAGGWIAGILLSFLANWAINHFVRASLQSVITPDWWPKVAAIALVASLLGAIYPGLRAARQDAIEALSYE
ncbi:MAG: ABC transporter permease [Bryobacteraceae bacterium]